MPPARSKDRRPPLAARLVGWLVASLYLRQPHLAEVVAARHRSVRGVLGAVANEIAYRLGLLRAPFLLGANLELTNHCNLRCSFCPTGNGRLARPRGHMSERTLRRALAGARPLEFALLFQWGEPLLHPRFDALARRVRRAGARTLLTTNGTLLDEGRVHRLLASGIDRITISIDGDETTHEAVRGVPLARTEAALDALVATRDALGVATAVDVSMVVAPETERAAESFQRRFADRVDRVQLIPLLTVGRRRTRCREPWRGSLVVLQDGRVTACCVDHDGALAVGHVDDAPLRDLFNGERMRALRRAHVEGDLPPVCARCTEYPTDAAAPRFSRPEEASRVVPEAPPRRGRTRRPERVA